MYLKFPIFLSYGQLSQGAYNTKENRSHLVMANEIRAEVSVQLYTNLDLWSL